MLRTCLPVFLLVLPLAAPPHARPASTRPAGPLVGVALIRREAAALEPLAQEALTRHFLEAAASLPTVAKRTLYRGPNSHRLITKLELVTMPAAERRKYTPVAVDESLYYTTKYGSPLAYARPLELLARSGLADVSGRRILDFGYGGIGHLRLLAALGAEAVGVDVDPFLKALYSQPSDTGPVRSKTGGNGSVRLIDGAFPSDALTRAAVGSGYDLFISKNTLKNGYLHPAEKVDPRLLVHLGVSDDAFVRAVFDLLRPGGFVMIYNICPAPAKPGKPYIPWADGGCPFPRAMWEKAGFKVLAYDMDDGPECKKMAHALGWDKGPQAMDLEHDLFAHYSIMKKPLR